MAQLSLAKKALYIASIKFPIRYSYNQERKAFECCLSHPQNAEVVKEQLNNFLDDLHKKSAEEIT